MTYRSPGSALPTVLSWTSLFCYALVAVASSFMAAPRVEAQSLQLINPSSAIASTNQSQGRVAGATIDGSGLNFLGGDVNAPSQYTVTGGTSSFGATNNWLSATGSVIDDQWLIVDLGQSFSLSQLSLFNFNTSDGTRLNRGVADASIFYFDGAVAPGGNTNNNMTAFNSTNWIPLGNFTFSVATNPTQTTPDMVSFNGANAQFVAIDINSSRDSSFVGIGELQFFELIPPPPPPPPTPTPTPTPTPPPTPAPVPQFISVVDGDAINQLIGSAIPMNLTIGQIASNVHNVGGRSLNQRIYRVRGRHSHEFERENRIRRSREVSAARYFQSERDLEITNTINLTGRTEASVPSANSSANNFDSTWLPSVVQQANHSSEPGVVASGNNWEVFASADFGQYDLDALGGSPGVESNTYAATAGIEYVINENWAVGAGWSHLWNDNTLAGGAGSADIEGDTAMFYTSYFKDNFWGDLFYSYGDYEADLKRNAFGSTLSASPDIEAHQTTLNLGYNIPAQDRFVHGPTFRADYSWGQLDGYTETGNAAFNTSFSEQEYESLITTLGWQINWRHNTCWGALRPTFRAGYGRENIDQERNVSGTLQQSPIALVNTTSGAIAGRGGAVGRTLSQVDPGEGWMEFGAGVGVDFHNNFGLFFDYQARFFQEDAQLHLDTVKASWRF